MEFQGGAVGNGSRRPNQGRTRFGKGVEGDVDIKTRGIGFVIA